MKASIVVPVYNGAQTLEHCLRALVQQTLPRAEYEIIVVDDGSRDASVAIAGAYDVRIVRQPHSGAPAARNFGIQLARGKWVAFTDCDCVPSRQWLAALLHAAERCASSIGATGKTIGLESLTPVARFVDLTGGLDAQVYLRHPAFPFAPTANVLYRRAYLLSVGGFDTRYAAYDACDLHTRLRAKFGGTFPYEAKAVVMHRHRGTWKAYWRQQFGYGVGYAQFLLAHRNEAPWHLRHQCAAAAEIIRKALAAALPARGDRGLLRRGAFIRAAAQHAGFVRTFYSAKEQQRW